MRLSVFGLGYVGCVSAACLAKQGHTVVGVEVNPEKIELINRGLSPVVEEGMSELMREVVESGFLYATADAEEAVKQSDLSLVCVGTPSRRNGSIDLSFVERVCEQIGDALRNKEEEHVVVIRSTVLPGSTEQLVVPALERGSGASLGEGFHVCSNPEFLREGSSIEDFYNPPFTLIGGSSELAVARLSEVYAGIDAPIRVLDIKATEMVKYACNSFHGLKVSFANEIGNICKALQIDSHPVMKVFCEDEKLNISKAYLQPGFAFGGSCLPKDLRAIRYRAKQLDVQTPVLSATLETNRHQIERAAEMVLQTGNRQVGIMGLSFKSGTDDLRESPMVALVEILIGKGLDLAIYDRNVSQGGLLGSNKAFIENQIPHIWEVMRSNITEVVEFGDTVVLGNKTDELMEIKDVLSRNAKQLVDLARVFDDVNASDRPNYQGICW